MSVWDDYVELKNRLANFIILANIKTLPINASPGVIADHLIANGVTIRERGEWRLSESDCMYFCSLCGYPVHPREQEEWDFCPHCGADMRGGKDEK